MTKTDAPAPSAGGPNDKLRALYREGQRIEREGIVPAAAPSAGEKKCALSEEDCCGADGPDCPYDATELAAMDRSAPAPSAGEKP